MASQPGWPCQNPSAEGSGGRAGADFQRSSGEQPTRWRAFLVESLMFEALVESAGSMIQNGAVSCDPADDTYRSSLPGLRYRITLRSPLGVLCASLLAISTLSVAVAAFYLVSAWRDLPDLAELKTIGRMDQATTVYDHYDRYAFSIARERRFEVPLTSVSPAMIHAILSIEDRRFYSHPGFDLTRIAAAMVANLRQRRTARAVVPITQQLARGLSDFWARRSVGRCKRCCWRAGSSGRSKPKILELHLNKVHFGDGRMASKRRAGYLAKHASEFVVADAVAGRPGEIVVQ